MIQKLIITKEDENVSISPTKVDIYKPVAYT